MSSSWPFELLLYNHRISSATFNSDNKAEIVTTQCEAYEVMKLSQGHTHSDMRPEQAYEEVGEGLVSGGRGPQTAARPQEERSTQRMYEEVARH